MASNDATHPKCVSWAMIEAFLDWDVKRVNTLIQANVPRDSPEWRITDKQVKEFWEKMLAAEAQ